MRIPLSGLRTALSASILALAACGDGTTTDDDADATDPDVADATNDEVETDTADTPEGDDDAPDVDDVPRPDAEDDADTAPDDVGEDVVLPNCDPPQRLVGTLCRSPFDRACLVDTDCRAQEACVWADTDRLTGTCIYTPIPAVVCPGTAGCESGAGPLRAAFGARDITPHGWELPREGYAENFDEFGNPKQFTGDVSDPTTFCDCGRDMLCPPTPAFEGCLSLGDYTAPDADGTEGDGYMQGAWLAGFNEGKIAGLCPADWLGPACEGAHCCVSAFAHDPLWVRGAVFEQGDIRVAWLSVDAIGYFYNEIQRNLAALPPELGVDYLFVGSTHTHNAPDTMGRWGPGFLGVDLPTDSGIVPEWMDEINASIVDLVTEAVGALEPVDLYATHVQTGYDGFAARDSRDPFIFTDLVTALRVVRAGQAPSTDTTLGVFVNWHSHPEAVGGDNRVITSDFPHYVRVALEQGLDAGAAEGFPARSAAGGVAVYASGAVGGLLTPLDLSAVDRDGESFREDSYEKARAIGERVADLTLAAFDTPCGDAPAGTRGCTALIEAPQLSFAHKEVVLDVENVNFQAAAITLDLFKRPIYNWRFTDGSRRGANLPKLLTAVAQLRLGSFVVQTTPGELFPEVLTGFGVTEAARHAIVGNPEDVNCGADRVARLDDGVEPRFACLLDPTNPAPPQLDAAPAGPGWYDTFPGSYLTLVGNGMDSIGYLIPSYDFVVHPDVGVLLEMPGDHYEEGVSVGDQIWRLLAATEEVTAALGL